jgi:RhtB (resistance to homoserine/threonine) family protein
MQEINYLLILVTAFFAVASPGPATLAIAGTSMSQGRLKGAVLALGITTGSLIWSFAAALGLSAIMQTHVWVFEAVRYLGAAYLLFLAYKSARSALAKKKSEYTEISEISLQSAYFRGLFIHLTNPKAILFFGSLYVVAVPANTAFSELLMLNAMIVLQGFMVFQSYALLFSIEKVRLGYMKLQRVFETIFAIAFGAAGVKVLTL